MLKSVDLFAGAGGLSCGLAQSGFKSIFANELVDQYAQTYQLNHPDAQVIAADIRQLSTLNLKQMLNVTEGEVDLVAGGPPCQGFSVNAPIRSLDDPRNHLFKDFLRVVDGLQPKAVLIENVTGIISLGKGTVIQQIYTELESMGYTVAHKILFSGHYGIPQMRFRTILIALKNFKREILFPEPKFNAKGVANFTGAKQFCFSISPLFSDHLQPAVNVWDALSDLPSIDVKEKSKIAMQQSKTYKSEPQCAYQTYLRAKNPKLTLHHCAKISDINLERLKYIPQGGSWRDIPHDLLPDGLKRARRSDHTKRYGRLHPNALCSTVLTKCDPHWGSFFHPTEDRVISVREAARIQSFPDDYIFSGSMTQQYEQIGNAVPPLLGKAVGDEIIKMLELNA